MARQNKISKFDLDPLLFNPEPPDARKHVKELFCGRDKELERGVSTLKKAMDVSGRRSKNHDKRPWVIHGECRSGKSHLARRILVALPTSKKKIQLVVSARERMTALLVMQDLFGQLRGEFAWRTEDQTLHCDPMRAPKLMAVRQLVSEMGEHFAGRVEDKVVTLEKSVTDALQAGINAGDPGSIFKLVAMYQSGSSGKCATEMKIRTPTPRDLALLCGAMIESLLELKLVNHVMVLVDDVDLLEAYIDEDRNARVQRSILSDALTTFHSTPGVDVLLTSRSWYAHSQKEFLTLVDLADADPMTIKELVLIHNCRYELLGPRDAPNAFLDDKALELVAQDSDGLPGVFLRHLDTAFHAYQNEDDWGERDYNWLLSIFRRRFEILREKCPLAAQAIEEAVRKDQLKAVDVRENNPFYATVFENEFVYQSYYSETSYFISGLMLRILEIPEEFSSSSAGGAGR